MQRIYNDPEIKGGGGGGSYNTALKQGEYGHGGVKTGQLFLHSHSS